MSTAIDNFTTQLHDNLEAVENRAKSLSTNFQSASKKTQEELQTNLAAMKVNLEQKKQEFDQYRTKLTGQLEEKESEIKSNVEEWIAHREVQKLEHRADKAVDHASTAIYLAIAAIEAAETATMEALSAKLDAETAAATKQ